MGGPAQELSSDTRLPSTKGPVSNLMRIMTGSVQERLCGRHAYHLMVFISRPAQAAVSFVARPSRTATPNARAKRIDDSGDPCGSPQRVVPLVTSRSAPVRQQQCTATSAGVRVSMATMTVSRCSVPNALAMFAGHMSVVFCCPATALGISRTSWAFGDRPEADEDPVHAEGPSPCVCTRTLQRFGCEFPAM